MYRPIKDIVLLDFFSATCSGLLSYMELLFPNPISTTIQLNINITAQILQSSFNVLGFLFLLTLSPFTHMQEYKIQTKAQSVPCSNSATAS